MAVEKRRAARSRKRFRVHVGTAAGLRTSFTTDVSETGLFVAGHAGGFRPGDRAELVVSTPLGEIELRGVVARVVSAPPGLQAVARNGFGVRLDPPPAAWVTFVRSLAARAAS